MQHYEIAIIGFGKGGKTLAAKLATQGKKVALIEKDEKMYGGTCINIGCIPSKSLVNSAHHTPTSSSWEEKQEYYRQAILQKRDLIKKLRQKNYDKLKSLENLTLYLGVASFINQTTLRIQGAEEVQISAEQIFINTGAVPLIPSIPGLKESRHMLTSSTLMDLEKLPKKLAIIGGGFIALEFASMYASFGSQVSILQIGDSFLPKEDRDIAQTIFESLQAQGIEFEFNVEFAKIEDTQDKTLIHCRRNNQAIAFECDAFLVATGRKPNTEELQCQYANLELDSKGAIKVNDHLQSNIPHIYALGDVNGGSQFTYVSLDDYRIIYSRFKGQSYTRSQRREIPTSVFIAPSYSRVGLNEEEARKAGYEIKVAKLPAAAIPKAQVLRKTTGLLKAIINAQNHDILGVMLFCEESHEMINLIKLAMDAGLKYETLRDTIYTHPTMSEIFNELFDV